MAWIIAGWLVVAALLGGVGRLVRRLGLGDRGSPVAAFWIGLAAVLLGLQVWHLFLPVDARAWIAWAPLALLGWLWPPDAIRRHLRALEQHPALTLAVAIATVALARLALGPVQNGDSGLYHLPSVRWAATAPAVPGLANLHPLLGLQSSYYLFLALFDMGPFAHRVQHLGPGLLVLALFAQSLAGLAVVLRSRRTDPASLFSVLLLPVAVDQLLTHDLVSASADLPATIMGAVLALALVQLLAGGGRARALDEVLLLAAAGFTLKLSFAAMSLSTALMALAFAAGRGRALVRAALLGLLGPGVFALRSAILTGYPAYPSTLGALPVGWRVPAQSVERVANYVLVWGRSSGGPPGPRLHTWAWVGPWLRSMMMLNRTVLLPLLLALSAAGACLVGRLRHGPWRGKALAWGLIPVGLTLGFWFATSPDIRFAGACFWLLPAYLVALALQACRTSWRDSAIVLAAFSLLAVVPVLDLRVPGVASIWDVEPAPIAQLRTATTRSGLALKVPAEGLCWEEPPPCTPFPSPWLRMRRAADLRSGFVLEKGHLLDLADLSSPVSIPAYR